MSDTAPPPAWQMDDPAPLRSQVQREHAFQRVAIAFIRRVVVPPRWVTAICHENELTENARARAKARGVEPGVHDLYVCQAPGRSVWLELKWGDNTPSKAQLHVALQLDECGIARMFCWSIDEVLAGLKLAAISLHGNAFNLATEYQVHAEAAVAKAEAKAGKPWKPGRPRTAKASPRAVKAAARFSAARLGV